MKRMLDGLILRLTVCVCGVGLMTAGSRAGSTSLRPADVLILVNAGSPVSIATARMYRKFHPEITVNQVLYLTGLPDCASATATPADEIITRTDFESFIAAPLRDYLISTGKVNTVYCFITTAGMPYRIEDSNPAFADVIKPAASDAMLTVKNRTIVDAASVESELAVLFQIDPTAPESSRLSALNRLVNPYQGYRSGIRSWAAMRDVLQRRTSFRWTYMWRVSKGPAIEGLFSNSGYSAAERRMSPADIYLVARLDGPRQQGQLPIFNVKRSLVRAAAASDPNFAQFVGYNPWGSVIAVDHAPGAPSPFSYTCAYNLPPQYTFLSHSTNAVPPGAESFTNSFNGSDHFLRCFEWLTGASPPSGDLTFEAIDVGLRGIGVIDRTNQRLTGDVLPPDMGLVGLLTYGCNGGDGRPPSYLLTGGSGGGPMFHCAPGAVFSSLESYNAVTMFSSSYTGQGKIVDFIEIGGSGAVGHAFEPEVGATFQGEFLMWNLLRDDDLDGTGDLCWVEAAASAMPYLSWSEVILGDPLMRLVEGPGGLAPEEVSGDADDDGDADFLDIIAVLSRLNTLLGDDRYDVGVDINEDGRIDMADYNEVRAVLNGL